MKKEQGWKMYIEIQQLKEKGFTISQIARNLGISRPTVYEYIDLTPDEFNKRLEAMQQRSKKPNHLSKIFKEMNSMSNILMIIGLLGLVAGVLSPIFRVLNKKPKRSKAWVIITILSFLIFILGVVLGME